MNYSAAGACGESGMDMKTRCHSGKQVGRAPILLLASLILAFFPPSAAAAGSVLAAPGEVYDLMPIGAVVLQPDGKILLADGYGISLRFVDETTGVFGHIRGGVFRLFPDGVADRTFEAELKPTTGSTAWERGLVLQPDGKVLTTLRGQPLVRLLPNGRLDPDFGLQSVTGKAAAAWARARALRPLGLRTNGEIILRVSSSEEAPPICSVAFEIPLPGIQRFDRDGRFLSHSTPELNELLRGFLTPAGVVPMRGQAYPDNRGGELVLYLPLKEQLAGPLLGHVLQRISDVVPLGLWRGCLRLNDGRMVVAVAEPESRSCGRLLRFSADWQLDSGFESRFELANRSYCLQLAEDPQGCLLVVGTLATLNSEPFTGVARLTSDGSTDRSFRVRLEDKHAPVALSVAVQLDARVLIGGLFTAVNGMPCTYFARLNSDGSVDEQFSRKFSRDAYTEAIKRLRAPRLDMASTASPTARSPEHGAAAETVWISAIDVQEATTLIEMRGLPNSTYVLQATDALGSGEWVVIATTATDRSGVGSFTDTTPSSQAMRVYRICSVP
jgi:uncharacterized delta-60 repeat protein